MNIGQAATASGVSAKMIRYYERIGLLGSATRTQGNYREFGPQEVHELRFIRLARALCFTVEEIADLLSLWRDRSRPSDQVREVAEAYLVRLHARATAVQLVADTLQTLAAALDAEQRPECPAFPEHMPPPVF
jgi:MerR family copper efflux transcriptional regulator/MerR family gold-responsive transcriptional activator of gol and ges genes